MAQMSMILSNTGGADSNLPENNQISSDSKRAKGLTPGMKVAVNAGIHIASQYAQKAASQIGTLYGDKVLQNNINEISKITSYGVQIATTGLAGIAMVAAEITYDAILNGIKDRQARNRTAFIRSSVGYVASGGGRYENE